MDLSKIGYFIPDVAPLLPHDMNKFWDIWKNYKEPLTKVKADTIEDSKYNDLSAFYDRANFEGMVTWLKTDSYLKGSTWKQNVVLEPSLWDPYVESLEEKMPWYECDSIILWAAIKPVYYHIDPAPLAAAPVAVRSLIYDTNPSPTFKLRHGRDGEERYVPYNEKQNLFAFNNRNFYHGADYHPEYYKILMKSFGRVKYPELLAKQIKETKEKGFPIWEVSDNA
jgi:hypothetical protein